MAPKYWLSGYLFLVDIRLRHLIVSIPKLLNLTCDELIYFVSVTISIQRADFHNRNFRNISFIFIQDK